jgi:hypothetical protein
VGPAIAAAKALDRQAHGVNGELFEGAVREDRSQRPPVQRAHVLAAQEYRPQAREPQCAIRALPSQECHYSRHVERRNLPRGAWRMHVADVTVN